VNKKLPSTFLLFDTYIPTTFSNNIKNIKNDNNKLKTESMLDSGSFCNFITEELVKTLNLKKYNLKSKIFSQRNFWWYNPDKELCLAKISNQN